MQTNPVVSTPPSTLEPATYTVEQIAQLLQCSSRHIRRLDDKRAIPGRILAGRLIRFSRQLVDEWLSQGKEINLSITDPDMAEAVSSRSTNTETTRNI